MRDERNCKDENKPFCHRGSCVGIRYISERCACAHIQREEPGRMSYREFFLSSYGMSCLGAIFLKNIQRYLEYRFLE